MDGANSSKALPENVMHSRKPYQKPDLREFGDVRLLTMMSGGSSVSEGQSGKMAKK